MAIKWKNSSGKSIFIVIVCAMLASTVMCNAYPYFRGRAQAQIESGKEKELEETQPDKEELFVVDDDFMRYLLSTIYYMNYEVTPDMDAYAYFTQNYDVNKLSASEENSVREAASRLMKNMRNQYTTMQNINDYASYVSGVEREFGAGNLSSAIFGGSDYENAYYQSGIVISYDSRGVPSVRLSWGMDVDEAELIGYLQQASMSRLMEDNGLYEEYDVYYKEVYYDDSAEIYYENAGITEEVDADSYTIAENNDQVLRQLPLPLIQNTTFAFGVHENTSSLSEQSFWEYWEARNAYANSGYRLAVLGIAAVMMALALIFQNIPALSLRRNRVFCLPAELTALAGLMGIIATDNFVIDEFGMYTMAGEIVDDFQTMGFGSGAPQAATVFIWIFWSCFAFCWYWLAASVLPYITHPIRTLKEQMLCIAICRWIKRTWLRFWHWATDVQLDEKMTRNIWKLVGINALIVAALCCIWIGGIAGTVIYSILLYVLLKKKCGEIQGNYRKLLHVTRSIAEGELNVPTDEDMGLFNPIRDELTSIQSGFKKAVNEEVRSRNMKTELITNVSHDLKTPLTAIITYVDLLKKEDITEEERRGYVDTLDKKSQRLKVLIEDLFEVSKATTDNITMNYEDVDLVSLMKQVRLENEDKIQESTLDFRWNLPEEKCILSLDPQRTFRIIENLVQNILKYSMPHSRVYIDVKSLDTEVLLSFKNMSAMEMNFSPEEITERFVRGDLSRNTEGSGLGLAIAQSFTERQNGTFKVETDADLFKVTIVWKK